MTRISILEPVVDNELSESQRDYKKVDPVFELINKNKEWIFSGVGVSFVTWCIVKARYQLSLFNRSGLLKVEAAIIKLGMGGVIDAISLTVRNTTKQPLFLHNFFLELDTREQLLPLIDDITGESQRERQLAPGQSFSFHITVARLRSSGISPQRFRCAAVRDALGNIHRSSRRELLGVLNAMLR